MLCTTYNNPEQAFNKVSCLVSFFSFGRGFSQSTSNSILSEISPLEVHFLNFSKLPAILPLNARPPKECLLRCLCRYMIRSRNLVRVINLHISSNIYSTVHILIIRINLHIRHILLLLYLIKLKCKKDDTIRSLLTKLALRFSTVIPFSKKFLASETSKCFYNNITKHNKLILHLLLQIEK